MGNAFCKRLFWKHEVSILFLGLYAAGKTTALYRLKFGDVIHALPSWSDSVVTLEHEGVTVQAWDTGGREKIRPLHIRYPDLDGIVFVVDSNNHKRIGDALKELKDSVDRDQKLRSVPVLILANKQDLPNAMRPDELGRRILGANLLRQHTWTVFGVSALSPDGAENLLEALSWLTDCITQKKKDNLYERLAGATEKPAQETKVDIDSNDNSAKVVSKLSYITDVVLSFNRMIGR